VSEIEPSRRNVLFGVAAAGVALPVLAACGSGGSDTTGTVSDPGTSGGSGGGIPTSEIPVGGGKILGSVVVTQPKAGEFKAFSSRCTHQGCTVTKVADGTIDCPCHLSRFSIVDGSVESGPAPSPLPEKTVTVTGSTLTVA
jgi:Rieske Fe-S protein